MHKQIGFGLVIVGSTLAVSQAWDTVDENTFHLEYPTLYAGPVGDIAHFPYRVFNDLFPQSTPTFQFTNGFIEGAFLIVAGLFLLLAPIPEGIEWIILLVIALLHASIGFFLK